MLISCSTTTYHAEIAPRFSNYTYKESASFFDPNVHNKVNSRGWGLSASLIETTNFMHARLTYFENYYSKSKISSPFFTTFTDETSFERSGIEVGLGPSISFFKPYVSMTHLLERERIEDKKNQLGFGLRIEIPVSHGRISLDYSRYEDDDNFDQGRSSTAKFSLGYMFGGWQLSKGKQSSKRTVR